MSYLSRAVCLVAILIASAVARPAPAAPVIVNGKFSTPGVPPDPFAGWSTDLNLGVPPLFDIGELAVFEVIGRVAGFEFARQLEQTFVLPTNALTLSFDFLFESVVDGSIIDPDDPLDSFQPRYLISTFSMRSAFLRRCSRAPQASLRSTASIVPRTISIRHTSARQ